MDLHLHVMDRKTAIRLGIGYYLTGAPCVRGHVDLRRTSSAKCFACNRENVSGWRRQNPELDREVQQKSWQKNGDGFNEARRERRKREPEIVRSLDKASKDRHRDKVRARNADERARNRERYRQKTREWNAANPDRKSAQSAERRALKAQRIPRLSDRWRELNRFCLSEAAGVKRARQQLTGFPWHLDHMVPLQHPLASGLHVFTNIEVVPASYNIAKSNLSISEPLDWARRDVVTGGCSS